MTLSQFLNQEGISQNEFARRIGAANARTVGRYIDGKRIPSGRMLAAIARVTDGQVTPKDFIVEATGS